MGAAADIGIVALPHDKLGTIMWTFLQNLGYMVITTHYVDADFKLRAKCATGGISWTGGGLTDGIRYVITMTPFASPWNRVYVLSFCLSWHDWFSHLVKFVLINFVPESKFHTSYLNLLDYVQ